MTDGVDGLVRDKTRPPRIAPLESVRNSVRGPLSLRQGKAVFEQDGKLSLGHHPLAWRHLPLLGRQVQHQEQELHGTLVGGKVPSGSDRPPQLGIQTLNRICGVDDPTDIVWEGEERDDFRPVSPPGLGDGRVFLTPWTFGKVVEGDPAGIGVLGFVDLLQRCRDRLAIFVRDEGQRMADQMDDAGLDLSSRKGSRDCLRETFQAVDRKAISTSSTPRLFSSFMTRSQNLAPSLCSIHSPRTSFVPSGRTPGAT